MKLNDVNLIAIIGTGMIGASLAALFAGNGYPTTMYAINDSEAERGLNNFRYHYKDLIAQGLVTEKQAAACEKMLTITQDYKDIADADFIYECAFENKEVKHSIYGEIEKYCTKVRGISSTSSAMDTNLLAEGFTTLKDKFAVAHPWNPPHLVPCVEVVKGSATSQEAMDFICRVLESVGRAPVVMERSVPGFVANRLQHALYREAAYMVEQGIASPQDIDKALMTSFAPRYGNVGIFEHFDYAGLDMIKSIEETLYGDLCTQKEPHKIVLDNYNAGNLGPKSESKKGILDWNGVDTAEFARREAEPYYKFFNWSLPEE